jgi:hypothetical protein
MTKKRKFSTDCIACGLKCAKGRKYVSSLQPGKKYRGIICPLEKDKEK